MLAVITVDSLLDNTTDDGLITLREAIIAANNDAVADPTEGTQAGSGADTINFDATLNGGTILLTSGDLDITEWLTIDATSLASGLTIDAQQNSRIANITATTGDFTFTGLTLTGGKTTGNNAGPADNTYSGGAIRSTTSGNLTFDQSTITDNSTEGDDARGGGIHADGNVTLTDSTVLDNSTMGGEAHGGGISVLGTVTLTDSTVSGNSTAGFEAFGGGIYAYGDQNDAFSHVTLAGSTVSGNSTVGEGAWGGGIYTRGNATINDSTIIGNNTAGFDAWAGGIAASGYLTLTNSTVSGNSTSGDEAWAGGIAADGYLTLTNSTVSGNSTSGYGADGGGISAFGEMMLINSTVSGNSTSGDDANGGGIRTSRDLTLTYSTVTNNHAFYSTATGGGIWNNNDEITIVGSIVAGNTAGGGSPDLRPGTGTLSVDYSLIGDNLGTVLVEAPVGLPDANGNLIGSSTGGGIINPLLAGLADNGGLTETHALEPLSPALDAGDPAFVGPPNFDQRSLPYVRVFDGDATGGARIDMGAFEVQDIGVTVPAVTVDVLLTTDSTPELTGTIDDLTATITVDVGGQVGLVATNIGDGTWILPDNTISPALADDTYDVVVMATNAALNVGTDASSDELTIDTTPPVVTVDFLLLTNDPTPQLTGTVDDPSATITVDVGGQTGLAVNNGDGTWTLPDNTISPALADDTYDVVVTATDAALNVGSDASSDELTIDTTAPVVTVDVLVTTDTTPELTGTIDDLTATIMVDVGGQTGLATVNNGDGTWTLPNNTISPALADDDKYNVVVTATDAAQNVGTDADIFRELTIEPVVTVDFLFTTDTTPQLTGTVEYPSTTITIDVGGQLSLVAVNNGDGTWTLPDDTLAALTDGIYDVVVTTTDAELNERNDATVSELMIGTTGVLLVDTLADENDGNFSAGDLSLREAIELSDLYPDPQTITFDGALSGQTITLDNLLVIDEVVTIDATALALPVTVDANQQSSVMSIVARENGVITGTGNVTLAGLTLTGGMEVSVCSNCPGGGGAIYFGGGGTLTLYQTTVSGNISTGPASKGGGIFATGKVTLIQSTVSGNSTDGEGGHGGGIAAWGDVTLIESTVSGNSTTGDGAVGGGISSYRSVTLIESTVSGNSTAGDEEPSTFGARAFGGGIIAGLDVTLTNSTVSGNSTAGFGAAGGGIASRSNLSLHTLTLIQSTVSGNSTAGDGAVGGGILWSNGDVTLIESTVSGNSTAGDSAVGGGIRVFGGLTLTQSTVSGNSTAGENASGGGIHSNGGGLTLTQSTVTDNHAYYLNSTGGGIWSYSDFAEISGSIIAGNTAGGGSPDLYPGTGTLSVEYSLIGDNMGTVLVEAPVGLPDANGNLIGSSTGGGIINPLLAGLADNEGPTETHALLHGGPAINTGDPAFTTPPDFDQRGIGFPRVLNGRVDIGAYEFALIVDNASDIVDGDYSAGNLSLREAVELSNANLGTDLIMFASGLSGQIITLDGSHIDITEALTIDARTLADPITIDGNQQWRLFDITATTGDFTFVGLTLTGGKTTADFAGGGAIRSATSGTLTFTQSTVSGNSTAGLGAVGGGVFALGAVTLSDSTVSGNSTAGDNSYGGGIYVAGDVNLTQSTLSGNSTDGAGAHAGGIYVNGALIITQSTVTDNHAHYLTSTGGGIWNDDDAIEISGSILSDNTAGGGNPDLSPGTGALTVNYSLIGTGITPTGGANNISSDAPMVGPLANNLGPTPTHVLLLGSPAIDAGDPTVVFDANEFDQRGNPFVRFFDVPVVPGTGIDIGAYELQNLTLVVDSSSDISDGNFSTGELSLREAVELANGNPRADTITFSDGLAGQTITLGGTEMVITDALTIDATALAVPVTIDGNQQSRLFNITATTGDFTFVGLTLTGGKTTADFAGGGAIHSATSGTLTFTQSTVSGNSTTGDDAPGGGIFALGDVTFSQSTVSENSTDGDDAHGGGMHVTGDITLTNSTLSGNSTGGIDAHGGGMYAVGNVVLTESTVTDNNTGETNAHGGGIHAGGDVTLTRSTVSNNSTAGSGADGGGIHALGTVMLSQSTVSANSTAGPGADGGGIYALSVVTLTQSTLSDNSTAGSGADGGGVYALGAVTLNQSTITANHANATGGGIWNDDDPIEISSSILSDNTAGGGNPDMAPGAGTLTVDYSLIGTGIPTGGTNNVPSDAPLLALLTDNGGPTLTHALLPGSLAIDSGDDSVSEFYDQRGAPFVRDDGNGVDIGAFELYMVEPALFVVNTPLDEFDDSNTSVSLREAIHTANAVPGTDTITFANGLAGQTITLGGTELVLTEAVHIDATALALPVTVDANQQSRIFNIFKPNPFSEHFDVTLAGLTLTGGSHQGGGGAIRSATSGTLTLTQSTVSENSTAGSHHVGGGIEARGNVTLIRSTVSGNSTHGVHSDGGGIFAFGHVTLSQSTVSGNSTAGDYSAGGGIYSRKSGVTLTQSTVSGNSTTGNYASGGGIVSKEFAFFGIPIDTSIEISGSIVAGNMAGGGNSDLAQPSGTLTVNYSLIGDKTGTFLVEAQSPDANGNLIGSAAGSGIIVPLLAPLADNGGPTQTRALMPGSPAIEAGDPSITLSPTEFDQRGSPFLRVSNGDSLGGARIDIGAFELVDIIAPTADITRAEGNPTNSTSVVFDVILNEDVTGVDAADFVLALTGTATGNSTVVVGNAGDADPATFTVTVDAISGDGTLGLDFAGGTDIQDLAGNDLIATPTSDEVYTVDNTPPTLLSFTRLTPPTSPTNADTLVFLATFDEDVINVDTSDFAANGLSANVSNVAQMTASTYEVTLSGGDLGSFEGVVGLNLDGLQDIADLAGNSLPAGEPAIDELYTVDNIPPKLLSFARQNPLISLTNANTLVFLATFDEDVMDVDMSDFAVIGSSAMVTDVSPMSGLEYEVTVSGGNLDSFDGVVRLDLDDAQDIADLAGNSLPLVEPATDEIYTLDNTAPTVDITRAEGNPTNSTSVVFDVTFSEEVTIVDADDFVLELFGTATGNSTVVVGDASDANPATYTVTVDTISGDGTLGLDIAGGTDIQDIVGNDLNTTPTSDQIYAVDNTPPTLLSFTRHDPPGSPTNADTLVFLATFDEDVMDVDTFDFAVHGTTTATVTDVLLVTASTYEVTISGIDLVSFDGVVGLDLDDAQDIADLVSHPLPLLEPATDEDYTLDNTPPVVTVELLLTNDSTPQLTGTVDDLTATITVDVDGQSGLAAVNNGDGTWTLLDNTIPPALADNTYNVVVMATDAALNVGTDASSDELTIDTTPPVVTVDVLLTTDTTPELTGTIDDLTATITINVGGQVGLVGLNNGDGTWTLPDDTISLALADDTYNVVVMAIDAALNVGTDASSDELTIDTTAPVVTVDFLVTNDPTPQLTGTIDDPSATITVDVDGQSGLAAVNNGDGTWTLPDGTIFPPLAVDTYDVAVTATDLLTNAASDATIDELITQLQVDILDDESDGNYSVGDFSLREAIELGNANVGVAESITFSAGLDGGTILLTQGELGISDSLTIDATNLTSRLMIDAQQNSRIFNITATTGDFTIAGLTLTGGSVNLAGSAGQGGAIRSLTTGVLAIDQSTIVANRTDGDRANGGGIWANGDVTLTQSDVLDNSTNLASGEDFGYGGGILSTGNVTLIESTVSGNSTNGPSAGGGGIFASGNVTLLNSTVSANRTTASNAEGGGINASGSVMVTNSTVSGNSTLGAGSADGGGIYAKGDLTISQSTITNNSVDDPSSTGGGIWNDDDTITIENSIVAGNTAGDGSHDLRPGTGTLSVDYSLIGDNTGTVLVEAPVGSPDANGNLIGSSTGGGIINPQLAGLADNGGPTETHALLAVSPAIDAGDPTIVFSPAEFDQRGSPFARVVNIVGGGDRIDIGAVELQGAPASLVVDTLTDELDADFSPGDLSLREAIGWANTLGGADTITFSVTGTINIASQLPTITDDVTINASTLTGGLMINAGHGTDNYFGTGDGHRIFNIDDGIFGNQIDVEISGLTLTGGDVPIPALPLYSLGGAILNRENLTVTGSTLSGNSASYGGGIYSDGTATIISSTISGNSAVNGGGIYNYDGTANITSSTISGNSASFGGGIWNGNIANITSSTISDNSASASGGGIANSGTANITSSTISGNSASYGGGIWTGDIANITSSTISGNSATGHGGGIDNHYTTTITSSTISGNSASFGGGIWNNLSSTATIDNTIVAENTAGSSGPDIDNVSGTVVGTFNLIGDGTGQTGIVDGVVGNQVGTSGTPIVPLLGPLADNGGPTWTHALLPGSPAIDLGDPAFSGLPDFDQRGVPFTRTYDGDGVGGVRIDMGAIEVQPAGGGAIAAFDADPQINGSDLLLWQQGLGISGGASQADGDATFDGEVTSGDLEVWELQFGTTVAPIAAVSTPISAQSFSTASTPTGPALTTSLASGDLVDVALAVALKEKADGAIGNREFVDHSSSQEYFSPEPIGRIGFQPASSISSPANIGATSAEESESPEPPVPWEDAFDEVFASVF